jgi:hypothetical protein
MNLEDNIIKAITIWKLSEYNKSIMKLSSYISKYCNNNNYLNAEYDDDKSCCINIAKVFPVNLGELK